MTASHTVTIPIISTFLRRIAAPPVHAHLHGLHERHLDDMFGDEPDLNFTGTTYTHHTTLSDAKP